MAGAALNDLERSFTRPVDRALVTHTLYQVFDWGQGHRLSFPTVELEVGFDGYQQLAEDADLGRRVTTWRARNPELAALLDAEAALDALAAS